MHLEELTGLSATEESPPTSPVSDGSAAEGHLQPLHDPGAHHPRRGHSGTHLSSSGL